MPSRPLDAGIDRLYQLPLDEFTAARNALAKDAGPDAAEIRKLPKPPAAAWAINQLYWQRRSSYDALINAADRVRSAHAALLSGKKVDVRDVGQAHEAALDVALKATLAILQGVGQPATDATKQAIATTLRALPAADAPGRLTRTLQPGGFEMLAGLPVKGGQRAAARPAASIARSAAPPAIGASPAPKGRDKAVARAKEAVMLATRALRNAEQAARREEFEVARASREADRAGERVAEARKALEAAQDAVDKAERAAAAAGKKKDVAARRAGEAEAAVAAARRRADAAHAELTQAEQGGVRQ
jgi:hypothetical protein